MKKNKIIFGAITIAILFLLTTFSTSTLAEMQSPLEKQVDMEADPEQVESPTPATVEMAFGFLVGALVIEEVTKCEQIGNTNWYSIDITGQVPGSPYGIDDFGAGKFFLFKLHPAWTRVRVRVKYLINPPDLVVGEYAGFGHYPYLHSLGIGIKIETLPSQ